MKHFGGEKKPFKKKGKLSTYKQYKIYLRSLAKQGIGHSAIGDQVRNRIAPDSNSCMARDMYFGYKFQQCQ